MSHTQTNKGKQKPTNRQKTETNQPNKTPENTKSKKKNNNKKTKRNKTKNNTQQTNNPLPENKIKYVKSGERGNTGLETGNFKITDTL